MRDGIPGSEWVLLEDSSHLSHLEEPDLYRQRLLPGQSRIRQ
jgi:pimeloyl-ACP methyl ester carboxylesterase